MNIAPGCTTEIHELLMNIAPRCTTEIHELCPTWKGGRMPFCPKPKSDIRHELFFCLPLPCRQLVSEKKNRTATWAQALKRVLPDRTVLDAAHVFLLCTVEQRSPRAHVFLLYTVEQCSSRAHVFLLYTVEQCSSRAHVFLLYTREQKTYYTTIVSIDVNKRCVVP
jgi:hypothetical protein